MRQFVSTPKLQDELVTEFDLTRWGILRDHVTIYAKGSATSDGIFVFVVVPASRAYGYP